MFPGGAVGGGLELCASFNVDQEGAEWIRLYFADVVLAGDPLAGTGAELRITSMLDGGLQVMNAIEVERWERSIPYVYKPCNCSDLLLKTYVSAL